MEVQMWKELYYDLNKSFISCQKGESSFIGQGAKPGL